MSEKDNNSMPTDDDLELLRELFEQADSVNDVRNLLQASTNHYEPTREQRQANVLRNLVNDVFGDQTHLTPQQHPAAAHFDRIVNKMSDEDVKAINAAAASTFGGPAFNPQPTPRVNTRIVHENMDDGTSDGLIHEEERKRKVEEQIKKGKEGGKKSKKTKKGKKPNCQKTIISNTI